MLQLIIKQNYLLPLSESWILMVFNCVGSNLTVGKYKMRVIYSIEKHLFSAEFLGR